MTITIDEYYDRFDAAKNYTRHLFLAGNILQSAEMNELQSAAFYQAKLNNDGIFRDGDVVSGGGVFIDTGVPRAVCQQSVIYLNGASRAVPAANVAISLSTTDKLGIWLVSSIITPDDDEDLLDPAIGNEGFGEAGADRLEEACHWGLGSVPVTDGLFYGIFDLVNGVLSSKNKPVINTPIAKTQIVNGLSVEHLGNQVYLISKGCAVIDGVPVTVPVDKKVTFSTDNVSRFIEGEVHVSTTSSSQRINLKRTPIDSIFSLTITKRKTQAVTRGVTAGGTDTLPDSVVADVISVVQGGTTYVEGVDFTVIDVNKISWSLAGAEPSTGSSYNVTYDYVTTGTVVSLDDTGFSVTGAVTGTNIVVSYYVKLPRIDLVSLDVSGNISFTTGISADFTPAAPACPQNGVVLAYIGQWWTYTDVVSPTVKDSQSAILNRLAVVEEKARIAAIPIAKRIDVFVDELIDNSKRSMEISQDAALFNGILTLPIDSVEALTPDADILLPVSCNYTLANFLVQESRNSSIKINPNIQAFAKHKPRAVIGNATNRWPDVDTTDRDSVAAVFNAVDGGVFGINNVEIVGDGHADATNTMDVYFKLSGFAVGETISTVSFDGTSIAVTGV